MNDKSRLHDTLVGKSRHGAVQGGNFTWAVSNCGVRCDER
jgi:hypothetical protein